MKEIINQLQNKFTVLTDLTKEILQNATAQQNTQNFSDIVQYVSIFLRFLKYY